MNKLVQQVAAWRQGRSKRKPVKSAANVVSVPFAMPEGSRGVIVRRGTFGDNHIIVRPIAQNESFVAMDERIIDQLAEARLPIPLCKKLRDSLDRRIKAVELAKLTGTMIERRSDTDTWGMVKIESIEVMA